MAVLGAVLSVNTLVPETFNVVRPVSLIPVIVESAVAVVTFNVLISLLTSVMVFVPLRLLTVSAKVVLVAAAAAPLVMLSVPPVPVSDKVFKALPANVDAP